ncbi:peptidoglycan DD-metalloendopeptidase family protein [Corynebacterium callunae]|uniref:M23 peptidase domain-containing protein n=1 Tax=Corynebacterium callunae DSM 20147 TaxID=1121353 RepID=M1USR6_9CORY|nr:peptidoglycan DD-metalloendopeptidase family protein [Corynebacterium callunae]AGG66192.1 M23 peptidase domain-containing protein [Corynebacterium callunae DSM 20147]
MKKVIAIALAIVLFIVILVSAIMSSDEEKCYPSRQPMGSGVPAGAFSLPEANAMDHITSGFRSADRPTHQGLDIAQGAGTPLYAFADGVVSKAGSASGFGQWIVLDHQLDGQLVSTVYGHLFPEDVHVSAGDTVKAGQHIGNEGYNGEVYPPGEQGAHLHFEVWPGGRDAGASVDPMPWLERAVEPGTADSPDTETSPIPTPVLDADSSTRLDETNLQTDAIKLGRALVAQFPEVAAFGGWRANGGYASDHTEGRSIDAMIADYSSSEGIALGNRIRDYVLVNKEAFNVDYVIWRQELFPANGSPYMMEDRHSLTENHFDHVHISVLGAGLPNGSETYDVPGSDGSSPNFATGDCDTNLSAEHVDADLDEATIPEELRRWFQLAGQVCPEVSAPTVTGLVFHESGGFNANAVSPVGAQGYGQFMPGTWASVGAKVDENGQVIGAPGSGSPSDPGDAIMASARYLCEIAESQEPMIASGEISGDPLSLMLAGYNAGPGAVQQYGGVPPYAETQKYVVIVPQEIERFTKV